AARYARRKLLNVSKRHPKFWVKNQVEPVKSARRDADNGKRMSRHGHRLSQNSRVAAKSMPPNPLAQHNHGRMLFSRKKAASQPHVKLRDVEIIRARRLAPDALRL